MEDSSHGSRQGFHSFRGRGAGHGQVHRPRCRLRHKSRHESRHRPCCAPGPGVRGGRRPGRTPGTECDGAGGRGLLGIEGRGGLRRAAWRNSPARWSICRLSRRRGGPGQEAVRGGRREGRHVVDDGLARRRSRIRGGVDRRRWRDRRHRSASPACGVGLRPVRPRRVFPDAWRPVQRRPGGRWMTGTGTRRSSCGRGC